jgi:hypothetical protein
MQAQAWIQDTRRAEVEVEAKVERNVNAKACTALPSASASVVVLVLGRSQPATRCPPVMETRRALGQSSRAHADCCRGPDVSPFGAFGPFVHMAHNHHHHYHH